MQHTLGQRRKDANRTYFLPALPFSAMIGGFFKRRQAEMLLYLLVPWAILAVKTALVWFAIAVAVNLVFYRSKMASLMKRRLAKSRG